MGLEEGWCFQGVTDILQSVTVTILKWQEKNILRLLEQLKSPKPRIALPIEEAWCQTFIALFMKKKPWLHYMHQQSASKDRKATTLCPTASVHGSPIILHVLQGYTAHRTAGEKESSRSAHPMSSKRPTTHPSTSRMAAIRDEAKESDEENYLSALRFFWRLQENIFI